MRQYSWRNTNFQEEKSENGFALTQSRGMKTYIFMAVLCGLCSAQLRTIGARNYSPVWSALRGSSGRRGFNPALADFGWGGVRQGSSFGFEVEPADLVERGGVFRLGAGFEVGQTPARFGLGVNLAPLPFGLNRRFNAAPSGLKDWDITYDPDYDYGSGYRARAAG